MNRYAILSEDESVVENVILADEEFVKTLNKKYIIGDDIDIGFIKEGDKYVSPVKPLPDEATFMVDNLNEAVLDILLGEMDDEAIDNLLRQIDESNS